MFWLGAGSADTPGEIPRASLGCRAPRSIHHATAVLHPFAATPEKTWPPAGFQAIARHLQSSGMEVVVIGGAGDDFTPFRAWRSMSGAPLAEVKNLLAGAALFVGNDSGPAHMAAALGVPSVVIFGPSDAAIWGPWRARAEVVRAPGGMGSVTVEQVTGALERLRVHA
jgi:heptosyltransferase-3